MLTIDIDSFGKLMQTDFKKSEKISEKITFNISMTDKFITDVYIFMLKIIFFGFMRFIGFSYFRSYPASYLSSFGSIHNNLNFDMLRCYTLSFMNSGNMFSNISF